ncbi:inositol polyphosphate 5-phosphatase [Bulinus truncatus]|nr:inositol polyphosphate 5-phosphatase [Bulinus truncatus]
MDDNIHKDGLETNTTKQLRGKKKGTLAKLKEKRQKDFGSNASLTVESRNGIEAADGGSKILDQNISKISNIEHENFYQFSTKDKVISEALEDVKPKPKPRFTRRLSGVAVDGRDDMEKQDNGKEKIILLDEIKNVKENGDEKSEVATVLQGSGFIPKPPSTPRTPKSTPRTPRGYVLPGKNDRRGQDAGSTLNVLEVEDKPAGENVQSESNKTEQKLTRRAPVQSRPSESVLNRKGSKDLLIEDVSDTRNMVSVSSKPPVNRSLASMNNENLENNKSGNINLKEKLESTSPKDKYLKSKKPLVKNDLSTESHLDSKSNQRSLSLLSLEYIDKKESSINVFSKKAESSDIKLHSTFLKDDNKLASLKSVPSPPSSVRLEPIKSLHPPPPLMEDFSSKTMRTSYKLDSNVKANIPAVKTGTSTDKSDSCADRLSQKSFTSSSVLPLITTKEARSRMNMFPETTIGSRSNSYLGAEELSRYFPDRKVNVFIGTWNMNELKEVKAPLEDFILPEKCDYVQDIYAIGSQENEMNRKEWELSLQEVLGPSHVLYHSVAHGSLHLVIFIRRDLIWFCSNPEDDIISLRALTMVKTKGAIGISMRMFGTSYLFINCHLTSDRDNDISRKELRLENYFKVIREMKLPKSVPNSPSVKKSGDVTTEFDCVFWFGDLNFRIERDRHAVVGKVFEITSGEFPNFETLLGGDQLLKYMSEDKIFGGFQEGRINFYPTFKFDLNKDSYDSSAKSRVPSYTDRVVFRCKKKNDIHCLHYDAVMTVKVSDHRPVFGQFETSIKPGDDGFTYSSGHFDRAVYMEALRRRATKTSVPKKQSAVCSVQ